MPFSAASFPNFQDQNRRSAETVRDSVTGFVEDLDTKRKTAHQNQLYTQLTDNLRKGMPASEALGILAQQSQSALDPSSAVSAFGHERQQREAVEARAQEKQRYAAALNLEATRHAEENQKKIEEKEKLRKEAAAEAKLLGSQLLEGVSTGVRLKGFEEMFRPKVPEKKDPRYISSGTGFVFDRIGEKFIEAPGRDRGDKTPTVTTATLTAEDRKNAVEYEEKIARVEKAMKDLRELDPVEYGQMDPDSLAEHVYSLGIKGLESPTIAQTGAYRRVYGIQHPELIQTEIAKKKAMTSKIDGGGLSTEDGADLFPEYVPVPTFKSKKQDKTNVPKSVFDAILFGPGK